MPRKVKSIVYLLKYDIPNVDMLGQTKDMESSASISTIMLVFMLCRYSMGSVTIKIRSSRLMR